jgi:undecaprenyl phosphate N,N'-diacetylbacillosamine 1-phosphate transferase
MIIYNISKRLLDFLISLLAILLLSPVMLILIVVIKLSSKGPAVFRQERAGKNGKPFIFYKFRTMKKDADPYGPSPKSYKDQRLTKIGKLLREYSLDELPQLFNILTGDMSIVGPRPLYISQISEWDETQKKRLNVKPGLTGLAQISGRGRLTREQKLELDVKYVETACFLQDVKITLKTLASIFDKKGIYEKRYSRNEYTRNESN